MVWSVDDKTPAYAGSHAGAQAPGRPPLDVPPSLRDDIEVPMPDKVAAASTTRSSVLTPVHKQAVAGKAVSLDARRYAFTPAQAFSAVVDAMTALNLPVASVDSPSGTLTTDWIGQDVNTSNTNVGVSNILGMFGQGKARKVRYRYIVRVLRTGEGNTQIEVRTLGQALTSHWYNVPMKKKVANQLFSAIEEQLARLKQPAVEQTNTPSGEQSR